MSVNVLSLSQNFIFFRNLLSDSITMSFSNVRIGEAFLNICFNYQLPLPDYKYNAFFYVGGSKFVILEHHSNTCLADALLIHGSMMRLLCWLSCLVHQVSCFSFKKGKCRRCSSVHSARENHGTTTTGYEAELCGKTKSGWLEEESLVDLEIYKMGELTGKAKC